MATENGGGTIASKRFCMFDAEEAATSLRTQISFPALLLTMYDITTVAQDVYDVRQPAQGAFMVADTAKADNYPDIARAYANTEKIAKEILQQIWADHFSATAADECDRPFKMFDFDGIKITPTGKILNSQVGWYVEFNFTFQKTINIAEAPQSGIFNP